MLKRLVTLVAALFALQLDAPVMAHQQKVALTIVLFNEASGNLEVMHKIFVHDAEHAANDMWGYADFIANEERQLKFADYVRARFSLKTSEDKKIELKPVGHEIEGAFIWVYHEAPAPAGVAALTVSDEILRDFWVDQANLVNVEKSGFRGSLSFRGEDGAKFIDLNSASKSHDHHK